MEVTTSLVANQIIEYPQTICLSTLDEYNYEAYANVIVKFLLNEVSDKEFNVQRMHNLHVLAEYNRKMYPHQILELSHFVLVHNDFECIDIYIDDHPVVKYTHSYLARRDNLWIIRLSKIPIVIVPDNYVMYFIDTYGINSYNDKLLDGHQIKCLCDGKETKICFQ